MAESAAPYQVPLYLGALAVGGLIGLSTPAAGEVARLASTPVLVVLPWAMRMIDASDRWMPGLMV